MTEYSENRSSVFLITLIAVLYIVTAVFIFQKYFIPAFEETQQNRMLISNLQQEIKRLNMENEQLKAVISALKEDDPAAWEDATRKYLGWVKPGEIIIETENSK